MDPASRQASRPALQAVPKGLLIPHALIPPSHSAFSSKGGSRSLPVRTKSSFKGPPQQGPRGAGRVVVLKIQCAGGSQPQTANIFRTRVKHQEDEKTSCRPRKSLQKTLLIKDSCLNYTQNSQWENE